MKFPKTAKRLIDAMNSKGISAQELSNSLDFMKCPTDAPQPGNKKSPDLHEAKPRLIDIRYEDNLILPL